MTGKKHKTTVLEGDRFEAVSHVVGRIAHDFNNLLTPLLAYPGMIKNELPKGSRGEPLVDGLEKTAREMVRITHELLDLTTGGRSQKSAVDLNIVLERVAQKFKDQPLPNGIAIECVAGQDLKPVEGIADRLMLGISNLCENGIEAMGSGGTLRLEIRRVNAAARRTTRFGHVIKAGEYVLVTINDAGPEIPGEIVDVLFEPFAPAKKLAGGRFLGLGLSVAYRAIRDNGASIDVESSQGQGTTFSLYFPVGG